MPETQFPVLSSVHMKNSFPYLYNNVCTYIIMFKHVIICIDIGIDIYWYIEHVACIHVMCVYYILYYTVCLYRGSLASTFGFNCRYLQNTFQSEKKGTLDLKIYMYNTVCMAYRMLFMYTYIYVHISIYVVKVLVPHVCIYVYVCVHMCISA